MNSLAEILHIAGIVTTHWICSFSNFTFAFGLSFLEHR